MGERLMVASMSSEEKTAWSGRVVAVQPRIRLTRFFDERYHSYLGYMLCIEGTCVGEPREFLIAVGEGAHEKYRFQAGMENQRDQGRQGRRGGSSGPGPPGKFLDGRVCSTARRTGSMKTTLPTGSRMIEDPMSSSSTLTQPSPRNLGRGVLSHLLATLGGVGGRCRSCTRTQQPNKSGPCVRGS